MIEATIRTAGQVEVLRAPAASIRRGDQVALLGPDGTEGNDIAGAVTAVRTGSDPTALVVANRVHFVPADHQVVIIRDPATSDGRDGAITEYDRPRGITRGGPGAGGVPERGRRGPGAGRGSATW